MGPRFLVPWLALLCGCASTFKVNTDPPQADVYVQDAAGQKKSIGKSPIEMPASAMKELVGETASGEFFTIVIERKDFVTERYLVPASRFGTLVTSLDVKLKAGQGPKEERAAREALDRLFLAQKLALTKQYERAQIELDRLITDFPDFPRAMSMRASVYYLQKNYPEALKWYDEALKVDPKLEEAVKMSAKVRELQGVRAPAGKAGRR